MRSEADLRSVPTDQNTATDPEAELMWLLLRS